MTDDLGIVIARNPDEEFWLKAKRNGEAQVKDLEDQLKFSKVMLEAVQAQLNKLDL